MTGDKAIHYPLSLLEYTGQEEKSLFGQNVLSFPGTTQKAIHTTDSEHRARAELEVSKGLIKV